MAFALGDIIYRAATGWKRLPGNTTATPKVLGQTGTGAVSAAPAWVVPASPGTGTVTNTGTLTDHAVIVGNGGVDVSALASLGTTSQVLHGNASGDPTFGSVALGTDTSGDLPFSQLTQGSALSVLGVAGNATADVASIAAGTDKQVLRRSGTAVGFGAVDLASSDAVTGDLPFANLVPAGSASLLVGRRSGSSGDYEPVSLGTGLSMSSSAVLSASGGVGGSGYVLLATVTASGAAAMTCTTRDSPLSGAIFQSDFDEYEVRLQNVVPATNAVLIRARVSTDGGATYDSTANIYYDNYATYGVGASPAAVNGTGDKWDLIHNTLTLPNSGTYAFSGRMQFIDPLNATFFKQVTGRLIYRATNSVNYGQDMYSWYLSATAVNAFEVYASSGNISGILRVYGMAK